MACFTSATASSFSKTAASPAQAWTAPVAVACVMESIWTAAEDATWTCTGNKVRQMGQYTVGGKLGKLKNWHRFTFPRAKAKQKVFSPEIFCPPNFSKNPILDLLAERKYNCQAKKATAYGLYGLMKNKTTG